MAPVPADRCVKVWNEAAAQAGTNLVALCVLSDFSVHTENWRARQCHTWEKYRVNIIGRDPGCRTLMV